MAPNLTGPARREKAMQAYRMAVRRVTFTEIGQALGVSRNLASTLVTEEQERQWEGRDLSELEEEKKRSIATYEEVIRSAWQRLRRMHDSSLNVSGIFNNIISAQKAIDEITGAKAPTRNESTLDVSYRDYTTGAELEELFAEIDEWVAQEDGQADSAEPLDTEPPH